MPNKIKPTPKRAKRHGSEVWVITEGNGTGTQSISRGRFHFPESQVDPRVKDLLRKEFDVPSIAELNRS